MAGDSAPGLRLGLDIGGTKTEAVALDARSRVVARLRVPTRAGAAGVLATAEAAVSALLGELEAAPADAASLGVGMPGAVDAPRGRVEHAVNLDVTDLRLGPELSARLNLPTRIENDATAAAWGSFRTLAAPRDRLTSLACLNVGTGLAAGLVLTESPWRGARGGAGEIGHLAIDPHGEPCPCGQRGCLETVASGSGIARRWGGPASDLIAAAADGDPDACAVWDDAIAGIAAAVRILVQTLDVELVLLGGGVVAAAGPVLLSEVRQRLTRTRASSPFLTSLDVPARLDALDPELPVAAIGAALLGAAEGVPWLR